MARRLILSLAIRRAIIAHARRDAPRECCGLLIGRAGLVAAMAPLRNLARGRTRYRLDPRGHIALRRALREAAERFEILGVYHSHPAGLAAPSPTDIAEAHYPDWVHLLVGLGPRRPQVRAFRIAGGRAMELPIDRPR